MIGVLLRHRIARIADAAGICCQPFNGNLARIVEGALLVGLGLLAPLANFACDAAESDAEQLLVIGMEVARIAAGERRDRVQNRLDLFHLADFVVRLSAEFGPADDEFARREVDGYLGQAGGNAPRPPEEPVLTVRAVGPGPRVGQRAPRDLMPFFLVQSGVAQN